MKKRGKRPIRLIINFIKNYWPILIILFLIYLLVILAKPRLA